MFAFEVGAEQTVSWINKLGNNRKLLIDDYCFCVPEQTTFFFVVVVWIVPFLLQSNIENVIRVDPEFDFNLHTVVVVVQTRAFLFPLITKVKSNQTERRRWYPRVLMSIAGRWR